MYTTKLVIECYADYFKDRKPIGLPVSSSAMQITPDYFKDGKPIGLPVS
jgi:hypothetical protein